MKQFPTGGHIIGKTSVENQCKSGSSFTCASGPVKNPYDETRTTGGSSGGSAALVSTVETQSAIKLYTKYIYLCDVTYVHNIMVAEYTLYIHSSNLLSLMKSIYLI